MRKLSIFKSNNNDINQYYDKRISTIPKTVFCSSPLFLMRYEFSSNSRVNQSTGTAALFLFIKTISNWKNVISQFFIFSVLCTLSSGVCLFTVQLFGFQWIQKFLNLNCGKNRLIGIWTDSLVSEYLCDSFLGSNNRLYNLHMFSFHSFICFFPFPQSVDYNVFS